jgi:hypothetical protein
LLGERHSTPKRTLDPLAKKPITDATPLLKPYFGAGAPTRARKIVIVTALLATFVCLPYGFYYALLTPWLLVPFIVPIAILLAITIWALPSARTAPVRTMEAMLFVLFAALSAWPNYLAFTFPGLPWMTFSRLVGTPMVILLLISLSTSMEFRARLAAVLKDSPVIWKALLLFTVLQGVSMAFTSQVGVSISKYVVHLTNETAAFFLCAYLFRRPGRAELWAGLLWGFAIFVGLIGIREFREEHVIWGGHVPSFLLPPDEIVMKILTGSTRATTGEYRAQSVFSTSLGFSEFMALAIAFPLHFAVSNVYRPWIRFAGAISIPFFVVAILDSGSRLGLLGLFLATMVYLLLWALRLQRTSPGSLVAPTVIVAYPALFSAFIVASLFVGRIKAKVWGMGQYDDSNQARIDQWHMGWPKILTHPLGHGVGTGAEALGYTNSGGTLTVDSYYLDVAMEYGLIGLGAFIAIFVISAIQGARYTMNDDSKDRDVAFLMPLTASVVSFLAMKAFFAQDDNHGLVFMMVGIMVGLIHRFHNLKASSAPWLVLPGRAGLRRRPGLASADPS